MKKTTFNSIKNRLTFWFLIIALTPLLLALVVTYIQRVNVIESRTFDKIIAIRDLKVERLNQWLIETKGDMHVMSKDNELRGLENILEKKSKSAEDFEKISAARELLSRYFRNYSRYSELFIVGANSSLVEISTNLSQLGENKSEDPYFSKPLETGEMFIKDIYYSNTTNRSEMTFSLPILCKTHSKHIIGILVARIDLHNSLYKMLNDRVGLGETGETLIVNKDVMALNELRWHENAPLNLLIKAEPAVDAANGKTGIKITDDYRGEEILAAYTYIPEIRWGFVCKQDLYELNEPIREMIFNFVLLFVLSALLIYFVAIFIGKSISKPIVGLDNVTKKIIAGDYSVKNMINSKDELGSLSKSINEMTESIKSKITIQKGTSEISNIMIEQTSMQDFSSEILKQLIETTQCNMGVFYILNELTSEFEHITSIGANEEMLKSFNSENPEGEFGIALSKKCIYHMRDIPEDTIFKFQTSAGNAIPKEIITIPILVENVVLAIISLVNVIKFNKESYDILEQSWWSLNSSYASLLANERTMVLAENLSRINMELETKSEELQEQSEELQSQTEELQSQTEELQQTSEELQEQNLELDMQRKEVELANKLKSEFLSNMSHELRTPLNSIMALSRVLIIGASDKLNEEENSYLEIVERNGKQLLSLINDILDLSKIEAGKMELTPSKFSLESELRLIKDNLSSLAQEKDIGLNLNINGFIPKVETDLPKLRQVFSNIIGNAIKFTEEGEVNINAFADSEKVYIEVEDSGIGISEDDLQFVFDEFRQVDGSSSKQYEGTGLGLAIVYKLIKILDGDIKAISKYGSGSKFTITFPIEWQSEVYSTETVMVQPIIPKSLKKTILVVDDNPEMVSYISNALEKEGYDTIGTTFGSKVLELAKKHQPYAITLDVIMPDMDGWEVLQKMKANESTKDIPVIIVSVSDDKETGFALGAVGYVNKPIDGKNLISEINKLHDNPKTIMIVDDNEMDRKRIAEILEEEKMLTVLAEGGNKCIQLLKRQIPDILVLDLVMPEMDGFQVLNKVRNIPSTKDLPIIIVTAKDLTRNDKIRLHGKVSSIVAKSNAAPQQLYNEIRRILKDLGDNPDLSHKLKDKSKICLLLVEDNESAIIQVKSILTPEGYDIDVARGGQEALDYIKHTIPDGIILDLMMPEIDGFEVLEKLRSREENKKIPVLILTAKDLSKADLSRLSANNVQQLIHKGNVDKNDLLFKIQNMVGGILKRKEIEKSTTKNMDVEKLRATNTSNKDATSAVNNIEISKKRSKPKRGLSDILVIEDNKDNMVTVNAILKNKYNIIKAYDGESGLIKAIKNLPDIILLDMSLPMMDGVEIVGILKSKDETKNIPVIALTARAMKEDKDNFLVAGCDDYISKPIDQELLLKKLEEWL